MSTTPHPDGNVRTKRSVKDLEGNQRSAALSQLHKAAEATALPNYPPESVFSPSALWEWIRNYLAHVFHKKHYFPPFTASPTQAEYDLLDENKSPHNVKVSIAGDWGTGTGEAESVANCMERFSPHFTIHLGDIYHIGDPQSVNENCLGIKNPANNYDPVTWPIGSKGSFALNGNHEMYANGGGYFDVLLPKLGLCDGNGTMSGQQTSFFCLQNQHWRIIAIDTGYNSMGVPILSHIRQADVSRSNSIGRIRRPRWNTGSTRTVDCRWGRSNTIGFEAEVDQRSLFSRLTSLRFDIFEKSFRRCKDRIFISALWSRAVRNLQKQFQRSGGNRYLEPACDRAIFHHWKTGMAEDGTRCACGSCISLDGRPPVSP